MKLNETQIDVLKELANIGVSKAATQLSILLSDEIQMQVPQISLVSIDEALVALTGKVDVSIVYQELTGEIKGRAHLIFQGEESKLLTQALFGKVLSHGREDVQFYESEAMMEIGNIVISTCLSTFANLLNEEIILSTPTYIEKSIATLLTEQMSGNISVLIIKTTLCAAKRDVAGTLIIVLDSKSTNSLLDRLSLFCENAEQCKP